MRVAAPIIKSAGGKTKLLEELVARAPRKFRRYFEPFVGGGALFFRLAAELGERLFGLMPVLGDANDGLINTYIQVAERHDEVAALLDEHAEANRARGEGHYLVVRRRWNDGKIEGAVDRAAAFIYLNRTCFNGLWRVNRAGKLNTPYGSHKNPRICDREGLELAAWVLDRVHLRSCVYDDCMVDATEGDFVYLDPPYLPVGDAPSFTAYTADGFSLVDQALLAYQVRKLADRGVKVMASNSDTPLVRALYAGMRIKRVRCPRAINSDAEGRGAVDEVIITAGYEPEIKETK